MNYFNKILFNIFNIKINTCYNPKDTIIKEFFVTTINSVFVLITAISGELCENTAIIDRFSIHFFSLDLIGIYRRIMRFRIAIHKISVSYSYDKQSDETLHCLH